MTEANPIPTPAETQERCAEIQATWTPEERMRRMRHDCRPFGVTADGGITTDEPSRASKDVLSNLVASKAAVSDSVAFDEH
jgi:hypothetical protein